MELGNDAEETLSIKFDLLKDSVDVLLRSAGKNGHNVGEIDLAKSG